jgi:hypothetical protein
MRPTHRRFGPMFGMSASITVVALAAASAAPVGRQAKDPGHEVRASQTAPYSGIETEEASQTLGDGNRMTRTTKWRVYRDSAGRTRREVIQDDAEPERVGQISISDANSATTYSLNSHDHTARKQVVERENSNHQYLEVPPHLSRRPPPSVQALKPEVKTESLGEKVIEGFAATGSRTTVTHPAGAFGFARPIVEVWETWSSRDLHTSLLNLRDDPRTGKDVVRLTDISTQEPPASLFEVPPDYTLTEETITRSYPGPPPKSNE